MDITHQLIGVILFLQILHILNRDRKPYFFGLTSKSAIAKNQLTKSILITLYLFIAIAGFGKLAQDLYFMLT